MENILEEKELNELVLIDRVKDLQLELSVL